MKNCLRGCFPFIIILALLLGSCTEFFSTSLASWAARDPSRLIPPVTIDNVNELIQMAENDPDLSLELLKKIGEAAGKKSGEEKAGLQAAAVEAAVNAVGLGQTLINTAGELANFETADAKDLVMDAINSMPNLDDASDALFKMLPKDPSGADFEKFIETAGAEDIAMAAVLLLAGEAKKYDSIPGNDIGNYDVTADVSDEAGLALALIAGLLDAGKDSELPDPIHNILDGLKLW